MLIFNEKDESVKPSSRIFSEQILKRFHDPVDCLPAHLMLECAEVLAPNQTDGMVVYTRDT